MSLTQLGSELRNLSRTKKPADEGREELREGQSDGAALAII